MKVEDHSLDVIPKNILDKLKLLLSMMSKVVVKLNLWPLLPNNLYPLLLKLIKCLSNSIIVVSSLVHVVPILITVLLLLVMVLIVLPEKIIG